MTIWKLAGAAIALCLIACQSAGPVTPTASRIYDEALVDPLVWTANEALKTHLIGMHGVADSEGQLVLRRLDWVPPEGLLHWQQSGTAHQRESGRRMMSALYLPQVQVFYPTVGRSTNSALREAHALAMTEGLTNRLVRAPLFDACQLLTTGSTSIQFGAERQRYQCFSAPFGLDVEIELTAVNFWLGGEDYPNFQTLARARFLPRPSGADGFTYAYQDLQLLDTQPHLFEASLRTQLPDHFMTVFTGPDPHDGAAAIFVRMGHAVVIYRLPTLVNSQ